MNWWELKSVVHFVLPRMENYPFWLLLNVLLWLMTGMSLQIEPAATEPEPAVTEPEVIWHGTDIPDYD